MNLLRKAISLLVNTGIIVEEETFELLRETNNPLHMAESFLETYPSKMNFTREDFIRIIKSPNKPQRRIEKVEKTTVARIPRRHHRQSSISSIDDRIVREDKNQIQYGLIKIKDATINSVETVIRTDFSDLKGLNGYESDFKVIMDPEISPNYKGGVENAIEYFQSRFNKLKSLFRNRQDIHNLVKIRDIRFQKDGDEVSVIGMISDKFFSPNGSANITLEDPVSDRMIHAILPRRDRALVEKCVQLMNDTVVCVIGFIKSNELIAKEVLLPDIPNMRQTHRAEIPVHVAFLSDIHIGSKNFMEKPMKNFIKFLNGKYGNNKMRAIGEQTKYLLFGGDVVDGVGIYVNQIDDLAIDDIKEQYNVFADFVDQVPGDVEIVIIPGNHDMVRTAEPQPRIEPQYAPSLDGLSNVHMLANPSQVSIHGIEVLMYHCTSMPDIMNSIPGVPNDKPVEVMKHMLKARHLAPIWGSKTPIATESEDHLVIETVPDIFHGGHIHINGEGYYKRVQIINSGTMQNQTSFQRSLNIIPTPGQISITNLKTFEVNRINFLH